MLWKKLICLPPTVPTLVTLPLPNFIANLHHFICVIEHYASDKKLSLNLPRYFMCLPQPLFTQSRLSFGYTQVKQITVYQSRLWLFVNENIASFYLQNALAYSSRSHLVLKKINLLSAILLCPVPHPHYISSRQRQLMLMLLKRQPNFWHLLIGDQNFIKIKNHWLSRTKGKQERDRCEKKEKSFEKLKKFSIQFPLFNTKCRLIVIGLKPRVDIHKTSSGKFVRFL